MRWLLYVQLLFTVIFETGLNKHLFEAKYNKLLQLDADGLHTQTAVHIFDLSKLLKNIVLEGSIQPMYLVGTERWNGMECYEALKAFYPDLECTFTSHHLRFPYWLRVMLRVPKLLHLRKY